MEGDTHEGKTFYNFCISIHSLRMEGDSSATYFPAWNINFNPLPPHGGRLHAKLYAYIVQLFQSTPSAWRETETIVVGRTDTKVFQSTPSAWRETNCFLCQCCHINISIHSLRMEGDESCGICFNHMQVFQSTPSAWRETTHPRQFSPYQIISIHSLRMEGDIHLITSYAW